MKKIAFICLFTVSMMAAWQSCKKQVEDEPFFVVEKTVSFSPKEEVKKVEVKTNVQGWRVKVGAEASSWLVATREGDFLQIMVKKNEDASRSATLTIEGRGISQEIKVQQLGIKPEIVLDKESIKIEKITKEIELTVTSNVSYELELPQWITQKSKTDLDGNIGHRYVFSVTENSDSFPRVGIIKVKSKGNSVIEKRLTIIQSSQYEGDNSSAIESDTKLKIVSGTASSQQIGEEIEKSFDGDMSTIYHSKWDNSSASYFPITLEYVLESPQNVDYMMYYPRTSGSNGYFKEVEIFVKTEDNTNYVKIKDFDFQGNGKATRVIFDSPITQARSFKLIVKSGYGDGKGFVSAAEVEFYKKNIGNFDPFTIFTDMTCSDLKSGITEQDIQAISNPFYRTIAMYMKNNEYPAEFRVQEYRAWANPNEYRDKYRMSYSYSNLDNPTGISVDEGEYMVVFVGSTQGRQIQIKIQNLDKPGGDGFDNASYHPLYEGVNKIKAGKKGLIYLQYQTSDYKNAPKIKVHFATGKVNGYFDKTKHTDADWSRLLAATTNKYFDVIGEKAHICFPVESYRSYTGSRGKELIEQFDKLINQTHEFAGLTKERGKELPNRAYFQVMYHSFMYCTAYRTSYNVSTMQTLCNPDRMGAAAVNGGQTDVWGPAHEIGHAHQVGPVFKWIGMTECTVNMNSMNIQTAWGIPTRLETESMQGEGGYNNRYEKAYNIGIVPQIAFGNIGDVFCNLVPFWQLNLYFSKVKNDPEFSMKMYDKLRAVPLKPTLKDGEYQVDFTKTISEVTGMNLIPFFEKWGFYIPIDKTVNDYGNRQLTVTNSYVNQIKQEINALALPIATDKIEYICDSNWVYFKNKANVIKGTATKNGRRITTSGYQNVVAYEVYENDQLIFVSNKNSFDMKRIPTNNTKIYAIAYDGQKTEVTF